MAQVHSEEDDARFVQSLFPAFRDPRYIRVQGRPLLIVYARRSCRIRPARSQPGRASAARPGSLRRAFSPR